MNAKSHDPNKIQSLFAKAVKRLQQGDATGARHGLLKVVKLAPDSAIAWYNLGLSHQHLGDHRKAIAAYTHVTRIKPDFVDGWVNLGLSYKAVEDSGPAKQAAESAAAIDPGHPRALSLLGTLAAENGDRAAARQYFESGLQSSPDFADIRFNLASLYLESGDHDLALQTGQPLFGQHPGSRQYRQLHAQILIGQRNYKEALPIVLKLQEEYPQDLEVMRLALLYREVVRDYFGAIDLAEALLELDPDDGAVWCSLGSAFFQLDSIVKSKHCYEKAIALDPVNAEFENNLGLAYSSMGDKENAERHYRRALELNPEFGEAYRNIVAMRRFSSIDDPDAVAIRKFYDKPDLDEFSTIKFSFALGKVYDDCGMYAEAFESYKRGNDIKFKESRIDLDLYFKHMDRFPLVFDRPPVSTATAGIDPKPIFILGMPRSGTTLVEQIISRHPDVFGCGELPCIERAITRMEKRAEPMRVYPEDFWDIPAELLTAEAKEYQAWVERLHDITTPCITDKMPFNFVHVWLIKAMFPDAPIVHCRRHPLDIITSNYFQLYGSDISFVYNLEALATYYVRYHRLMRHWERVFGDGVTQIQYERLIQDSDNQTRLLIDAIGLPWTDACLDQKRSDTAVRTASIWQVRQGIYTSSKERWRHYERELSPAIDILVKEDVLNSDLSMSD